VTTAIHCVLVTYGVLVTLVTDFLHKRGTIRNRAPQRARRQLAIDAPTQARRSIADKLHPLRCARGQADGNELHSPFVSDVEMMEADAIDLPSGISGTGENHRIGLDGKLAGWSQNIKLLRQIE